jgi:hypothetical protein
LKIEGGHSNGLAASVNIGEAESRQQLLIDPL